LVLAKYSVVLSQCTFQNSRRPTKTIFPQFFVKRDLDDNIHVIIKDISAKSDTVTGMPIA